MPSMRSTNSVVSATPSTSAHNLPYPYVVSITTGEPGSSRRSAGSYRLTAQRRSNVALSPLESLVSTVWVAGPQVRWKSTKVPSLSNRMARIGIVPRTPGILVRPHDPSSRAEATALTGSRRNSSRGVLVAAGLAAALFSADVHARDATPIPRLRPSIPADTPIIPLPRPRPVIPAPPVILAPEDVTAEPPAPSACQLRLTADIERVEPLAKIT